MIRRNHLAIRSKVAVRVIFSLLSQGECNHCLLMSLLSCELASDRVEIFENFVLKSEMHENFTNLYPKVKRRFNFYLNYLDIFYQRQNSSPKAKANNPSSNICLTAVFLLIMNFIQRDKIYSCLKRINSFQLFMRHIFHIRKSFKIKLVNINSFNIALFFFNCNNIALIYTYIRSIY